MSQLKKIINFNIKTSFVENLLENLESTIKILIGPYFKQIMFMVLD